MTEIPIPTQEDIDAARREGEKKLDSWTSSDIILLKNRMKSDLFFLCKGILGYPDLSDLHKHYCAWLDSTRHIQFRLSLLPRQHLKSTIVTITDTVQILLPDVLGNQPYPRNLGPECRVLIGHEVRDKAAEFLSAITTHFMKNPWIVTLFPEIVPREKLQTISKYSLDLPRKTVSPDPTVGTIGVGGRSQGAHYHYIKPDDIYGDEARDSDTIGKRVIKWMRSLLAFTISPATDHIDYSGTRYKFDDVYHYIEQDYGSQLVKYVRSVEEWNEKEQRKVSIWPEKFPSHSLEILRRDPENFNSNYLNDPSAGAAKFKAEWLRYYEKLPNLHLKYKTSLEEGYVDIRNLNKVILCDPAITGLGGTLVTGVDSKSRIFILEAIKKVTDPTSYVDLLFSLVSKYNAGLVVIEAVVFSKVFEYWLQREMKVRGIRFRTEAYKTKKVEKKTRILGLSNWFSSEQIFFSREQEDLITEYMQFGASDNIHMLDALAQGPEFWRPGRETPINTKQVAPLMPLNRDTLTGYSLY